MPELPEMELLKDELNAAAAGKEIIKIIVRRENNPDFSVADVEKAFLHAKIAGVRRKGKLLLVDADNDNTLLIHLMMVGQLRLTRGADRGEKYTEVIFCFDDGANLRIDNVALQYIRFGKRGQVEELPAVKNLGPDPLTETFTLALFKDRLRRRRGKIKTILTDQTFIAGIGNTYVDELLFAAGIRPDRGAGSLTNDDVEKIHAAIKETLKQGIALGGSSDIAFIHLDGSKGSFQEHFRVNRRKGKPCPVCRTIIEKITVGGRGTYVCPQCQE